MKINFLKIFSFSLVIFCLSVFGLGLKKNNRYGSLEYLKTSYKKKGIEVLDLTNILRVSAQEKAREGKLIYWSDDTHWNKHGIRSGMKYLLSFIKN